MSTNLITSNAQHLVASTVSINMGSQDSSPTFIYSLLNAPWYSYVFFAMVIFLIFLLIRERGISLDIDTFFGKIKIPWLKKNAENAINMCDLCKINMITLIANITDIYEEVSQIRQNSLNEQLRELDNLFIIEASWINNLNSRLITEKLREKTNISEEEKAKIYMKNGQILNYIWMIKKQQIYDFLKNIILCNHFVDKNPTELRFFVSDKAKLMLAYLENGQRLYPDWEDKELLFRREEYGRIMIDRVADRTEDSIKGLLEKCQIIQRKNNAEIQKMEDVRKAAIEEFNKSIPARKVE